VLAAGTATAAAETTPMSEPAPAEGQHEQQEPSV